MKAKTNNLTIFNIIKNPTDFFIQRIANTNETVTNALNKATMDMFLGRLSLIFEDNPTASAIFRDTFKISTAINLNGT